MKGVAEMSLWDTKVGEWCVSPRWWQLCGRLSVQLGCGGSADKGS